MYFYVEGDSESDSMAYSDSLDRSISLTTKCCRRITFTSDNVVIQAYSSSAVPTIITFSLQGSSIQSTFQLFINVITCRSYAVSSILNISQSAFTVTPASFTGYFSFSILSCEVGCFYIHANPSSSDYKSEYMRINVTLSKPIPKLSYSKISNDGSKLFMYFDRSTNMGAYHLQGYQYSFPCDQAVEFVGAALSTCYCFHNNEIMRKTPRKKR